MKVDDFVSSVNPKKQDLAWVRSGPGHTLFDHGLIQRVNVSRFDVFTSIFLESGQPISNAVWQKCRKELKTSHQNPPLPAVYKPYESEEDALDYRLQDWQF